MEGELPMGYVGGIAAMTAGFVLASVPLAAAEEGDALRNGIASSFATPFGQLLDGTADESLSIRVAADVPMGVLQPGSANTGAGSQGTPQSSPTLQVGLKYVPLTSWFFAANFLGYARPNLQKPWNPDFTYAFGYDDWHPYTFSAQYANFGGNRLRPDSAKRERRTDFMSGTWNAAFKFPLPESLNNLFLIGPDDSIGCTIGVSLTPRYTDLASNSVRKLKRTAALGCKYSFAGNWYFNFSANKFLVKSQQQPWDPDFTYGFGYSDWHPGTLSVQYNNYSGNRFGWHTPSPGTGRFRNGSITFSTSFAF